MYLDWIISSLLGKGNQGRPGLKFVSNLDSFVQQDNVNKLREFSPRQICPKSLAISGEKKWLRRGVQGTSANTEPQWP